MKRIRESCRSRLAKCRQMDNGSPPCDGEHTSGTDTRRKRQVCGAGAGTRFAFLTGRASGPPGESSRWFARRHDRGVAVCTASIAGSAHTAVVNPAGGTPQRRGSALPLRRGEHTGSTGGRTGEGPAGRSPVRSRAGKFAGRSPRISATAWRASSSRASAGRKETATRGQNPYSPCSPRHGRAAGGETRVRRRARRLSEQPEKRAVPPGLQLVRRDEPEGR